MLRGVLVTIVLASMAAGVTVANVRREPNGVKLDWQLIKTPIREVLIETPARGEIVQRVSAPGKVEAVDDAEIAAQVVGRVTEVLVDEGDQVRKGDVLVKLDAKDARARLDSSRARIDRIRAVINQAENDLAKAHRDAGLASVLSRRGFATPTEVADAFTTLVKAQATYIMSKHDLAESEAMRRTSEEELRHTEIRAPMDGVVASVNVEVGEVVIAGTTNLPGSVLMKISNLNHLRVSAEVDEAEVPLVRPEQPVRIFLQADLLHPVPGSVDLVEPKAKIKGDVVSFDTMINIDLLAKPAASTAKVRPGMSATVEIEVRRTSSAVTVPAQAVVHRRRRDLPDTPEVREWAARNRRSPGEKAQEAELRYIKLVFVLDGETARARPVETGLSDERRAEVLSGLRSTDRVIVGPFRALDELKDGFTVKPVKVLTEVAQTSL